MRDWQDMQREIERYEGDAWRPAAYAYGSIAIMLVVGLATDNVGLALLPIVIGMTVAIVLSGDGVECPACHATIQHGTHGNPGALLLLKNLRQCPYCQCKFGDASAES